MIGKRLLAALVAASALALAAACSESTASSSSSVIINNGPTGPTSDVPTGVTVAVGDKKILVNPCRVVVNFTATVSPSTASQTIDRWEATGGGEFHSSGNTAQLIATRTANYSVTAILPGGQRGIQNIYIEVDCDKPPVPQCRNGIDDDRDGKIDHPSDPGCNSPDDDNEYNAPAPGPGPGPSPGPSPTDDRRLVLDPPSGSGLVGSTMVVLAKCLLNDQVVSSGSVRWSTDARDRVDIVGSDVGQSVTIRFVTRYETQVRAQSDNCGSASGPFQGIENTPTPTPTPVPLPDLTCSFDASPNTVSQGGKSILSWNSNGTVKGIQEILGDLKSTDSREVILGTTSKTFVIECTRPVDGLKKTASDTVIVTVPACPTTIDYTPKGQAITKGSTANYQVVNWPSNVACVPFHYSDRPDLIQVLGADEIWTSPSGAKFFAGVNAQVKAISVGETNISAQTSIAINWVKVSYKWSVMLSTALEGLGLQKAPPPLPKHNIYTDPDVCQTYPCSR